MAEPGTASPQHALIIANPTAGTTGPQLIEEVAALCRSRLPGVRLHLTTRQGDAVRQVRQACSGAGPAAPPDLVVAVGGDGTVREVVEGLAGSTAALFIVPAGTGNSGYRMLWGERPWRAALLAVLGAAGEPSGAARLRGLDLARLAETGAKVFLGACSGVIAEALVTARSIPLTGRQRYAAAFQRTAEAFTPYPGRVTVDGQVLHEGPTVLANVGGGRYRGGEFLVLPHSVPDDGLLDVCVVGGEVAPTRVPELTRHAEHVTLPGVAYGRGRRIVVERLDGEPLRFEHDGELQPLTGPRMTLEVLPGALTAWGAAVFDQAVV
ncbi:diacylglycerol/lipid kinase family protein [Streptantibioticus silvisoli]|jgi:diacylglycerol kinase (ATP)|uniref:Diacylglycerol kinase family protein n=1 Tax=Streptantibioticus silvisoli TaxID=2705255 RepID=A0ABT6VVH5_9ACTN|nr:diacylglycerol kinase family protein [Streptantibioticus silvisoli]MDI5962483.1 diacylglycerol kinase family protein [Streptantibioticus silvisoli]